MLMEMKAVQFYNFFYISSISLEIHDQSCIPIYALSNVCQTGRGFPTMIHKVISKFEHSYFYPALKHTTE